MDAIALSLFAARLSAACDEMGAVLRRTAFSPNIRERLDYSCAFFGADGRLAAQAAHIPVHLGSMAFAMAAVVDTHEWSPGDALIFNDPFLGGTHLPDVTLVLPVFAGGALVGFVANRAHHGLERDCHERLAAPEHRGRRPSGGPQPLGAMVPPL